MSYSPHIDNKKKDILVLGKGPPQVLAHTLTAEFVATPLCLGNISKDWSTNNMKRAGFNGYVYDFGVDYDATDVDDIKDIHEYLTKKNNVV